MIRCARCDSTYASDSPACPQCSWRPAERAGFVAWAPDRDNGTTALRPESFRLLAECEERHFWFRARNRVIVTALRRHAPSLTSFLEIGCGTGVVLAAVRDAFPAASLIGTELATSGLGIAAHRLRRVRLMQMDGRHIPYEDEFDAVGAFDVLEHIEQDADVAMGMAKAVRPGGIVIATVPQHRWLWSGVDEYGGHYRRYTRIELNALLANAGLVVEHVTSFMTLIVPAMLLSRLSKRDPDRIDPAAELKIGPAANALFGAACACEARALDAGWSLPIGGSLLAVGRKPA